MKTLNSSNMLGATISGMVEFPRKQRGSSSSKAGTGQEVHTLLYNDKESLKYLSNQAEVENSTTASLWSCGYESLSAKSVFAVLEMAAFFEVF